jgi:hypothetical protein
MRVYTTDYADAPHPVNEQSLLTHLHRGGTYAYLWRSSDKQSRYFAVGTATPAATSPNVYFGVHPVTTRRPAHERGRIEDVAAVNCLFAEFDCKDFGSKDAIREHLEARAMLWPSVIVDSGGGWHCYWLLDQPHILRNDADRKAAAALQARFVLAIGGDPGAKDLARVLRLPGTLNAKYDPPRPVEIIEANDVLYTLDELGRWVDYLAPIPPSTLPHLPTPTKQPPGIAGILATVAAQGEGNRNSVTYWAAQRLREKDVPQGDADAMLIPIAQAIGLPEAEARRTVASAYRGAA